MSRSRVDAMIPSNTPIRSTILSFLPAEQVVAAADIGEDWFSAAAEWAVWQPKFAANSRLAEAMSGGEVFHLPLPRMYAAVLKIMSESTESFDKSLDAAEFYNNVGQVIGLATARYTTLFPVLHVYVRHPRILAMPLDKPVREGYVAAPRWAMILANIARWHVVDPRAEDIPWLLSVYDWAITTPLHFHKLMLASPVYALTSRRANELVTDRDVEHMLRTTKLLIDRFVTSDALSKFPADSAQALAEDDPRQIFSIYYHVQKAFPGQRDRVDSHVERSHGDYGKSELAAAAVRVELLMAAEKKAREEKQRKLLESINEHRKELGMPPLSELPK